MNIPDKNGNMNELKWKVINNTINFAIVVSLLIFGLMSFDFIDKTTLKKDFNLFCGDGYCSCYTYYYSNKTATQTNEVCIDFMREYYEYRKLNGTNKQPTNS